MELHRTADIAKPDAGKGPELLPGGWKVLHGLDNPGAPSMSPEASCPAKHISAQAASVLSLSRDL